MYEMQKKKKTKTTLFRIKLLPEIQKMFNNIYLSKNFYADLWVDSASKLL